MMQNHTGHDSMESEFLALRRFVQDKICKYLEGTPNTNLSSEWKQVLPDIAKRLEEAIFKESSNKDDYMNKFQSGIQSQVKYVLNQIKQNQPQQQQTMVQHNIQSNSSVSSMMIPKPPGISHNPTGTMRMPSLMESNQGINPTSVPAGIPMSNGYQLSHGNMSIDQPGSTSISTSIGVRRPVTPQMIRTPGFNSTSTTQVTQQTMPLGNGSGMQTQKQQQYNTLSGQVRPGMHLFPMNQKHSSQGFGDGMMNNNNKLGLLGNNMPQQVSEGYMSIGGTYGDLRKPLQQGFSSQQIQPRMPTSLSEQCASLMGNNIAAKHVDMTMSSSGNYYNPEGPSNLSSASHLNKISTIAASLQSKPRPMMLRGGNQLHQPSMQQQQPMMMGGNQLNKQSMQHKPMMMMDGNQLHQQSMQHHHQQQKQQPMMTTGGNQLQQQPMMTTGGNQLQQQPMMTMGGNNTFSRQSSLGSISSFGGIKTDQAMVESALLTNNHLMLPQHADFQVSFGNNKEGQGQFFDPLAGCNASNQAVSSDELSSLNGVVNNRSRGRVHQPDSMLIQQQSQWRPTQLLQQNNHQMVVDSNNNSHNRNALIEKNQIDQSCMTILLEGVQAPDSSVTTTLVSNEGSSQSQPSHRKTQHLEQMKMILFLFHAISCPTPVGHCHKKNCLEAQQLYKHIKRCCKMQCRFHLCLEAKMVLLHFRNCQEENCPVCILHNKLKFMAKHKSLTPKSSCGLKRGINDKEVDNNKVETAAPVALPAPLALKHSRKGINQLDSPKGINKLDSSSGVCSDQMDVEPLPKRPRMDVDISLVSVSNAKSSFSALQEEAFPIEQQTTSNITAKQETNVTIDPALQNLQIASAESDMSSVQMGHSLDGEVIMIRSSQTDVGPASLFLLVDNEERNDENATEAKQQEMEEDGASGPSLLVENEDRNDKNATEVEQEEMVEDEAADPSLLVENKERNDENESEAKQEEMEETGAAGKSGKPIINGVSMMELFTPEQVREHIKSLRQWVGQRKSKAEKNHAILMNENSCQLCSIEKLTFEPPPIYCTQCWNRIKRKDKYYTIPNNGQSHYICISCFNAAGENINIEGHVVHKTRVVQKRNNEETEEAWVQCDKCEAWQHQICALFNGSRNEGGQAEYTCPNCYIQEVETGERKPLPQSAVLGAKDLPRTILSDHIENRLFKRLKEERQDRANYFGKSFDEIQGAEELVVRVVSSVDKRVEVKPRFLEVFRKENYPTEFPYKSKAILLFQKIEGVEVCVFGMYVQEFGTECAFPNQRRVYLSYLDSIKYFRPEIRTVSGEALRTFVYHEILIGYLDYVKRRGFTSCYIWACPPPKCEDYILYCHPKIQKTPKSYILREWYLSMLKKAVNENIVVDLTNMYDHFFTNQRESKAKVTAVRLPYFDGDYWPGAAEDMITQLRQEEDSHKQNKKGNMKKTTITKRTLKPAGYTDSSVNASMEAMFMHKLGETIFKMKEDLIMVHLQYPCNHCCILMVSGTCWVCNICRSFNLCESCYNVEKLREDKDRHPIDSSREKHTFRPMEISGVLDDTKDKDDNHDILSEFFDTRQAFLSLCQVNHYQFNTLRSAKHSSMMVLYHLHNPTVPAYLTTCTVCSHEIEVGQGWRCEECPDFDVCNSCYQKKEVVNHPHKLTNLPSNAERDAQSKEAWQKYVSQKMMLKLLRHASVCRSPQCQYPNCRKIKGLFRHGVVCQVRINKGCDLCKKMWYLLQLHACACNETVCTIPRCKDLKEQMRRIQQQSESRRRAAVNEMMKQRAAEIFQNQ